MYSIRLLQPGGIAPTLNAMTDLRVASHRIECQRGYAPLDNERNPGTSGGCQAPAHSYGGLVDPNSAFAYPLSGSFKE